MTETVELRRIGRMYRDGQRRVVGMVAALPEDGAKNVATQACPEWSVHDVTAHLTGVADDIIAGRIDGATTDAWTAAQVERRRDRTTAEVLAEWEAAGLAFAGLLDDLPGWFGVQAVMDLMVHEQDIRGALSAPGSRDSDELIAGLDMLVCAVMHPVATVRGLPALTVRAAEASWVIGGEPAGDSGAGDPVASALLSGARPPSREDPTLTTLVVSPYELFRAATGRRSEAQIRAYDWIGDSTPYMSLFGCGPFTVRDADLIE